METKNNNTTQSWIGPAIGAATGILGMLGQRRREKRAMKNQQKLMGIQFQNQKLLNQQGHELQMEAWEKTNYPAQMKMLKEAGLNPGLLYGMGGAGGATTGSQGGGSAQSGNAPAPQPMELGTALQAAMTQASIELAKSQAEKARAEAKSLLGEDGTVGASQVESNLATALNQRAQAEVHKIGAEIGRATMEDQIDQAHYNVEQTIKLNNLTDAQAEKVRQETVAIGIKMKLDKANIEVSKATVDKIVAEIAQGWKKLDNDLIGLMIANEGNKLRALEGKADISKIQADFALGILGKEIDLHKLNIDQQRIFASIFQSLFVGGAVLKPKDGRTEVKGYK